VKKKKVRVRRNWAVKPATRVMEDKKKKYNRQKSKQDLRKLI